MAGKGARIEEKALELLRQIPNGIRYSELIARVQSALGDANKNTIQGTIWDLDQRRPSDVYKPSRGVYRHTKYRGTDGAVPATPATPSAKPAVREEDFYQPFADFVKNETEDCSKAIPLGGNRFKEKWGTPDVIGIKKANPGDIVPQQVEIVSAEIKTNPNDLITAFGQACSYKLFSHKTYIVIPEDSTDVDRLDSLCLIFGIGLVTFTPNKDDPGFKIRVRPAKHEPDMFYVNRYMAHVAKELFS